MRCSFFVVVVVVLAYQRFEMLGLKVQVFWVLFFWGIGVLEHYSLACWVFLGSSEGFLGVNFDGLGILECWCFKVLVFVCVFECWIFGKLILRMFF